MRSLDTERAMRPEGWMLVEDGTGGEGVARDQGGGRGRVLRVGRHDFSGWPVRPRGAWCLLPRRLTSVENLEYSAGADRPWP